MERGEWPVREHTARTCGGRVVRGRADLRRPPHERLIGWHRQRVARGEQRNNVLALVRPHRDQQVAQGVCFSPLLEQLTTTNTKNYQKANYPIKA